MRIDECPRSNVTYGNQPCGLVAALEMGLRATQRPVQAHLGDDVGIVTCDATASAYGPLTDLVGGAE